MSKLIRMPDQMTSGFGFTAKRHEPCRSELDQKGKWHSLSVQYAVYLSQVKQRAE